MAFIVQLIISGFLWKEFNSWEHVIHLQIPEGNHYHTGEILLGVNRFSLEAMSFAICFLLFYILYIDKSSDYDQFALLSQKK